MIKIGSKVIITEDVEMFHRTYKKGHKFKVYGSSYRGWDLIDADGNCLDETLFIDNIIKLDISEERKMKLINLNELKFI